MFGYAAAEFFRPRYEKDEGFKEPTDGTLRYRPWGAMPANPYLDQALKDRQSYIGSEFIKLFNNPPDGTPPEFAEMLLWDHEIGEQRRSIQNFDGYTQWLATCEPITEDIDRKADHFEHGSAYAGEILDFALATSIDHFEVGKVTHPYRQRLEHVEPFRREVEDAIKERGGLIYPKVMPYRSIDIMPHMFVDEDGQEKLAGFIVKYKRDFGHINLADGSGTLRLVERQLAGFRVDEAAGFNPAIVTLMDFASKDKGIRWDGIQDDQFERQLRNTGARGFIEKAVQTDSLEDFVVPISTTIYGFRVKSTPRKLMAKKALKPVDINGIAYFGPPHNLAKIDISPTTSS